MNLKKILVMASGEGTNFQSIIDACGSGVLPCSVVHLIVNKKDVGAVKRASSHHIPINYRPWIRQKQRREEYDSELAELVNHLDVDLIILAGWMHLFTEAFLNQVSAPIINLHPAYPSEFPGKDAIGQAWTAFQQGKIKETGIMVHFVIPEMDAGEVIKKTRIPIFDNDNLDSLTNRIRTYEKYLLVRAIEKLVLSGKLNKVLYKGKVRDVVELDQDRLILVASDRQSAFDRQICIIPEKGKMLTQISKWWFEKTKHIVPNHYLSAEDNKMTVLRCVPYKVEVVVRGFMTGSTTTSLWTHYCRGVREYCGHKIREGYRKNEKLDEIIVTPTTKGKTDDLISGQQVVDLGLMSSEEWSYCHDKALELFKFGQNVAQQHGLILVDTKFEFGYLASQPENKQILLIDELFTVDSSRYWLLNTYPERFDRGEEPEKFDKDVVRDWVRSRCDPYRDKLPPIPQELIDKAEQSYRAFYDRLLS